MANLSQPMVCHRALVTGATGFIGCHLVRHLLRADCDVHVLVRPDAAVSGKFPPSVQSHVYTGETEDVVQAVQRSKPDVVFHLASLFLAQHDTDQIAPMILANVMLGTQLLEAMSCAGVRSLVNTGTSWQYFHRESYRPVNLYASTKQAFEDIVAYYADAAGIKVINLCLFDSYGSGDTRMKLLRILLQSLDNNSELQMSSGQQVLDLAHVDDICDAYLHAARLLGDPAQPQMATYAVSGGQRMTLREIVATLEKAAGRPLRIHWGARPYRPREVMQLWDGPAMPGWQPAITLAEGFKALLRERRR